MEKMAYVEYHSKEWELLVEHGYVTMTIEDVKVENYIIQIAKMLFTPKWWN